MPVRPTRQLRVALILAVLVGGLLPAAVQAATVTVHMAGGLSPRSVTVAPGTTVRWINDSDDRHRMRSRNGPVEFDSGNIEPGESFAFTFGAVGTYPYLDDRDRDDADFHGTVVVTAGSTNGGSGGGSGSGGGGSGGGGAPAPAEGAPTSATVRMAGRTFSPGSVTIAAGGSVTFVNDDDREHTATGDGFDTGVLNSGARSTEQFASAGSFSYLCQIHPEMRGTISVRAGSGNAPPPPAATPVPATSVPSSSPPSRATDAAVAIVDFSFDPALVEVTAGTTVTWTNRGAAPHTVTANAVTFDSGLIAAGGAFSQRFDAPGRFTYACAFHPDMVGTVAVEASSDASSSASPSPAATASPSATPSSTPDGGGNVAAAPPADGAPEPTTQPINALVTDGFVRVLLVAVIVAGGVVAFGALVVTSARPNRARR